MLLFAAAEVWSGLFFSAPNAPKGLDPQKREMLEARFVGKVTQVLYL